MASWFNPTSMPVIIIAGLLTLAVLILTIVVVPVHRPKNRIKAILQQTCCLLVSTILVISTTFLWLNRGAVWYNTWSSLLGQAESAVGIDSHNDKDEETELEGEWRIGTPTDLQADPNSNPAFDQQTVFADAPSGQYISVSILEPVTRVNQTVTIWLPPSYASATDRFYPVLVGFPGFPGWPDDLIRNLDPSAMINSLNAAKAMRESIVVLPPVFLNDVDTECVDASDGSVKIETYISDTIVDWIKTNLRADPDPAGWATFGYSSGGYCASMIAMRHPDTFSSAISLSGLFTASFEGKDLLAPDDKRYDLNALATSNPPAVNIWYSTAKDDPDPYQAFQQFSPLVTAPTTLTSSVMESGGHTVRVWKAGFKDGLTWLGENQSHFSWVQP